MNKFFYGLFLKKYEVALSIVAMGAAMATITLGFGRFMEWGSLMFGVLGGVVGAIAASMVAISMRRLRNRPTVFVSYTHDDAKFVERLVADLATANVVPMIEKLELKVGENIRTAVDEMIDRSDYFLFVVSKNSMQSSWAKEELKQALRRKKKVLPAVLDMEALPEELRGVFYADFSHEYETGSAQLIKSFS